MPIPDYQTLMLPLLRCLSDGQEHSLREAIDRLGEEFQLTDREKLQVLPSGQQVFRNRVAWAGTYIKKAGLVEATRRGHIQITDRGRNILAGNPDRIDARFLGQFIEFKQFRAVANERDIEPQAEEAAESDVTPEEALESASQKLRDTLASDLLVQVRSISPGLFEKVVVELLVKMGYGGSRQDAGKAIGKSGDEGIDGIIKEDRLGLDIVYLQAKRWASTVGRPEVQKFAGALQGQRAKKGIMITTSTFSQEAVEYASRIDSKIVLIDGENLAQLMMDNNLGVSLLTTYEVKKMDTDYFAEE